MVMCHLYLFYDSAHVIKAIPLSPGQDSASWEEFWAAYGLTRQDTGGNRNIGIIPTAPIVLNCC